MNKLLVPGLLALAAASSQAGLMMSPMRNIEQTDGPNGDPADLIEKALGPQGQLPAAATPVAPASAGSGNPLARGSTGPDMSQPPAPPPPASTPPTPKTAPPAPTTPPPPSQRTLDNPWNGLQNTGPVPQYDQPAPCAMPGDPWAAGAPKCPPGYQPGQQPLQCGAFATMVNIAGSVVCVSNQVGVDQLDGGVTTVERSQAQAYLVARGLPASAAMFAAFAMNGPNLKDFTCSQAVFTNRLPMQAYQQIEWNLIFFDYVYGGLSGQKIADPPPALCQEP